MSRYDFPKTAAQWAERNPVLRQGEYGVASDTGKHKFGDGITPWNELPFFTPGSGGSGGGSAELPPQFSADNIPYLVPKITPTEEDGVVVLDEAVDLNEIQDSGFYRVYNITANPDYVLNAPDGYSCYELTLLVMHGDSSTGVSGTPTNENVHQRLSGYFIKSGKFQVLDFMRFGNKSPSTGEYNWNSWIAYSSPVDNTPKTGWHDYSTDPPNNYVSVSYNRIGDVVHFVMVKGSGENELTTILNVFPEGLRPSPVSFVSTYKDGVTGELRTMNILPTSSGSGGAIAEDSGEDPLGSFRISGSFFTEDAFPTSAIGTPTQSGTPI